MAGKKLTSYVYVNGDLYGPDDDVPADVAEQITNPRAWGETAEDPAGEQSKPVKKAAAKRSSSSK